MPQDEPLGEASEVRGKREIEADPENPALWNSARFTYATQVEAEDETAERFVLDQLDRRGTLNTTELKALAKGTGVCAVDISTALNNLSAIRQIDFEKGPNNSHRWHLLQLAEESRQPRQPHLPCLPEVAGQAGEATPVVAPTGGRATGAGSGVQPGQPDAPHPVEAAMSTEGDG